MRGPNSQRSLRATGSTLVILIAILVTVSSPAYTRSVDKPLAPVHRQSHREHHQHERHEIRHANHGFDGEQADSNVPRLTKVGSVSPGQINNAEITDASHEVSSVSLGKKEIGSADGKSSLNSGSRSKIGSKGTKVVQEGIRRFDAVVISDDSADKTSGSAEVKGISLHDRQVDDSLIGQTVVKGIIVRDAPIDNDGTNTAASHVIDEKIAKDHRKRSLNEPKLIHIDPSIGIVQNIDAPEKNIDIAESQREPVLVPVLPSQAGFSHELSSRRVDETPSKLNAPGLPNEASSGQEILTKHASLETVQVEKSSVIVNAASSDGHIEIHGKTVDDLEKPIVKSISDESAGIKKIIIHEDGLGEVKSEQVSSNVRKSLLPEEEAVNDEEVHLETVSTDNEPIKLQEVKEESLNSFPLPNFLETRAILEDLKLKALSLQALIRNKTFLEMARNESYLILPEMPKFSETQLLNALMKISMAKTEPIDGDSYFAKEDNLSESQLQILKCTESLIVREQRQTFAENMRECIRGLSILNCMRIFVWPIVVDNMPTVLSQNLPTFPIEVNIADWLPGNRQEAAKSPKVRSSVGSSSHQRRLITPEFVVSNILKDALSAKPTSDEIIPTFVDPKNETLGKLLTIGQLDILRMAEEFLPESARQEYSDRMNSCIRRFEYFSCVKYFAWPMVKQHFPALPEFPDYQSWYPSVSLYPGYPVLPYPNAEGIGELPEVIEADATRTRSPRPEAIIVQILENTLRQTSKIPYSKRIPATLLAPVTTDQMGIFYTAEQLIPVSMRPEFIAKTMQCIRDHDYLTCTKYSTWPTVRQFYPGLPQFPDLSSWVPTFAVPEFPDFSQYIPDFASYFPGFPALPGGQQPEEPQPTVEPQPIPDQPPSQSSEINSTSDLSEEVHRQSEATDPLENRIIQILSNIRWTLLPKNAPQVLPVVPGNLAILSTLSYSQLRIFGLSKSIVPPHLRGDLESRFVGCLQGGSIFLSCTRNVIWPTLQLYVKDLPLFPQEEEIKILESMDGPTDSKLAGLSDRYPIITPAIYQPNVKDPVQIAGRSPVGQIVAESEEDSKIPSLAPEINVSAGEGISPEIQEKSADARTPLISITETRFTPIYSDHPESVLLKILTTIRTSSKDNLAAELPKLPYLEFLNEYLSSEQKSVIYAAETLLPAAVRSNFIEGVSDCAKSSNFIACSRDIVWPTLLEYYPRLPTFPNFNIENDLTKDGIAINSGPNKSIVPVVASSPISQTDVTTGQHGDAMVTITDTRFVPIFTEHPEELILGILKNLEASSPNSPPKQEDAIARTPEFLATFTEQQGTIITATEILLPAAIRQVFNRRMTECMKDNEFLDCTRDIAWPTIAQFFPRLPNFPNVLTLPGLALETEEAKQPTLLPPQLEPVGLELPTKPTFTQPPENFIAVKSEDEIESRLELNLKRIAKNSAQSAQTYLHTADPVVGSFITDRQANIIRMCEELLPNSIRPIFVGNMLECARGDVFTNCIRTVLWPTLRQWVPNAPQFPDFSNFGSFFPQALQELPQAPQFPNYQVPNFPGFGGGDQGFHYPFVTPQNRVSHPEAVYFGQGSIIASGQPNSGYYVRGIQGLTPSVGSSLPTASDDRTGSSVVSARDWGRSINLSDGAGSRIDIPESASISRERRRERRSLDAERPNYQDRVSNEVNPLPPNVTDSNFLKILSNITKNRGNDKARKLHDYYAAGLNPTIKESLNAKDHPSNDITSQKLQASVLWKIMRCLISGNIGRCMIGIFMWPIRSEDVPSYLNLPIFGWLKPSGRSQESFNFEDVFGVSKDEFERELLEKRDKVEAILIDWYRGLVEEKFDKDYGFMKVRGYGDGEIGLSIGGPPRKARAARLKDSKNMPSILTIISDIMEDMLDQKSSKPDNDKKKDKVKKEKGRRGRKLNERPLDDDLNRLAIDDFRDTKRSANDDELIAMFLDKIRPNGSIDDDETGTNNYLSAEDAYEAFELLFGTRLTERMAERLKLLDKEEARFSGDGNFEHRENENITSNKVDEKPKTKKNPRSGLVLMLPRMDEEFLSRKMTMGLVEVGRKMKIKMSQVVIPGITFVVSFFIQMALAHARAAASVAGMMSNMALGSAMFSMIRQTLFGSMTQPKIKYVYDNAPMGPGITWPQQNYHH